MRPGSSAASLGLCRSLCIYRLTAPVAPAAPLVAAGVVMFLITGSRIAAAIVLPGHV